MIRLHASAFTLLASWLLTSQPLAAAAAAATIVVPPPDLAICPPEMSPSSGKLHSQGGNKNDSEIFICACFSEHEEYKIWRYRDDRGLRIEAAGGVPGVRETVEAWDAETQLWSPQWCDGEAVAVYVESEGQKVLAGGGTDEGGGGPQTTIVTKIVREYDVHVVQDSRPEGLTRSRLRRCAADPANCPESLKRKYWLIKCAFRQMTSFLSLLLPIAIGELVAWTMAARITGLWATLTCSHLAGQYLRVAAIQESGDELLRAITRWNCGCELPFSRDAYLDMLDWRYRMLLAVFLVARWVRMISQRRYGESYPDLYALGTLAYLYRTS
ncbi:ubiquitinyl hydrolase 1 [Pestalotiopsis sp. IQ-011]